MTAAVVRTSDVGLRLLGGAYRVILYHVGVVQRPGRVTRNLHHPRKALIGTQRALTAMAGHLLPLVVGTAIRLSTLPPGDPGRVIAG